MTVVVRVDDRTEVIETRGSTAVENRGGGRTASVPPPSIPATLIPSLASYFVTPTDRWLLVDTTANAVTINLQAAAVAGNGHRVDVKLTAGANIMTIDGSGTETIDGDLTVVVSGLFDNVSLLSDGSNWHII